MNFLQKLKKDKVLTLAFLALGLIAFLMEIFSSDPEPPKSFVDPVPEQIEVDTMIPAGHLLIPLELSNAESLASLSGAFSVVDLYATSEKGRKSYKVASAVKLLRAPLNPQQFAVLIREEESAHLGSLEGPFFAALKNPKEVSPPKSTAKKPSRVPLIIEYGE